MQKKINLIHADTENGKGCVTCSFAYRVGKKLDYDGEKGVVTNSPEASDLLARKYRDGWTLNG